MTTNKTPPPMAELPRPALQLVEPEMNVLDDPLMTDADRELLSKITDSMARRVYWITHLKPARERGRKKSRG